MAYFISNQDSTKGKDPYINIINGIHNVKGKTSVNILVSNYTNKHITFNKGEYIGHLEPSIDEIPQSSANPDSPTTHSITIERIMAKKVKPDIFKPPHHRLNQNIETKLTELLKEYDSVWTRWNLHWNHTPDRDDNRYRNQYHKSHTQ